MVCGRLKVALIKYEASSGGFFVENRNGQNIGAKGFDTVVSRMSDE